MPANPPPSADTQAASPQEKSPVSKKNHSITGFIPEYGSHLYGFSEHLTDTPPAVASLASLTQLVQQYLPESAVKQIRDAYRFSDAAHLGQFRQSGEPYISHPIAVAEICAQWRLDQEALMSALLHDVMEDSGIAKQELLEKFGPEVAELVDGLSKLDKLEFQTREEAQAENFRKMLLAMAKDVRVILVKLADRLHNMRTLDAMRADKRRRIARETLEIYAPIANRLGLNAIYRELQDLSFKAVNPYRYQVLRKAILAARGNRREVIGKILQTVKTKLPSFNIDAVVFGREKTIYGIYRKMLEKHLSFSQVLDIYGFRIVVENEATCYLALGALHSLYKPMPGKFKDYIAIPKVNGYQSLHTTLIGPYGTPVEFQIRSREMHRIAEGGVAAHWLYKNDRAQLNDLQKHTHQWLQSLLDIQNQTRDADEFLEHVKVDLYPDAVYVFTPRGKILAMPRGATAIDFAYYVHTDIGNHAIAAKIDGTQSPLRTELKSGNVVEILTANTARPNPSWLNFVRTGRARSEIRHYLKTMKLEESIALGDRLLEQAWENIAGRHHAIPDSAWQKLTKELAASSKVDILADIGLGRKMPAVLARRLYAFSEKADNPQTAALLATSSEHLQEPLSQAITVSGNEGSAVHYSTCCHPLPGDPVIGHMRGGQGLFVHTEDCHTARRLRSKDPERWVEIEWALDTHGLFDTRIDVEVINGRGVLGKVAAALSEAEANIVQVQMDEEAGTNTALKFKIQVHDRVHLARVFRSLRNLAAVTKIHRLRH
ncbi:RelA/SpoT family protein [Parvibium lacunae]|uniref:Bifunctional (P)ppGpp synthetase/guanosine-3',5'-bis(Diphosphate) 3'-pyrophosphohydrolase n=1 Tax=Parvibium lacunae TaxID=1888893 RepID=A0A368L743_9BURK|nr:bifunctional (p)ppGpp synthetase/guanosine-3',5'-bis(diphosphate) 3'-pyrophosphohydrolase [Parvibium lacunae]RCS59485.1 bifunctional (p)ppGpp synthetase/guanosine-3',5'-bis(diphosphate) 3'-pyrophosphohydrolase [Parvibium lacunae]